MSKKMQFYIVADPPHTHEEVAKTAKFLNSSTFNEHMHPARKAK
jgi:hypothetical protein